LGKWTTLKRTLPPVPADAHHQAKVDDVKAALTGKPLMELASAYDQVRAEKDIAEKAISEMNVQLEALTQLLVERLEDLSLTSIKLETGGSFLVTDTPYASITDKQRCREWFEAHDQRELLNPHHSTLNALIKGRLEAGDDPDAIAQELGVKIFMKTGLTRRKH
jgi:hypothetical protein